MNPTYNAFPLEGLHSKIAKFQKKKNDLYIFEFASQLSELTCRQKVFLGYVKNELLT